MSVATARAIPAIVRLLQRSRPKTIELPGVHQMIESYARASADTLRQLASLESTVAVESFEQGDVKSVLHRVPGTLLILSYVPYWNARIAVRLERNLLIRAIDAMYGGDPKRMRTRPPARALSPIERSLAMSIARGLVADLLIVLGESERSGPTEERLMEPTEQENVNNAKLEYATVALKLVEFGEQFTVAFPISALERLAEQIVTNDTQEQQVVDLDWTQQFKRNVERTTIELVAKIEGPRLFLSDIAALRPGSLIEFDREFIGNVTLVTAGQPVFKGRLGQSRGNFTVLLDHPLPPPRRNDDQT